MKICLGYLTLVNDSNFQGDPEQTNALLTTKHERHQGKSAFHSEKQIHYVLFGLGRFAGDCRGVL